MANQIQYGFYDLRNVLDRRVTEIGVSEVMSSVDVSLERHVAMLNDLFSVFVARTTTDFKIEYRTVGQARLQPMDDIGRALPIQTGAQYERAFPWQEAGSAWGRTWRASVEMTVGQVNELVEQQTIADANWMRDHVLGALLQSASYSHRDLMGHGTLTIQPLASGDAEIYPTVGGALTGSTADHILAQAAAIADGTNPYETIVNTFADRPGGGDIVAFIPNNLVATTRALTSFYNASDPNIRRGIASDVFIGGEGPDMPGTFIGYVEYGSRGVLIREWRQMPASYIVAVDTGQTPPLTMRQHDVPELQGFRRLWEREDLPWYASEYRRWAGFGVENRLGAIVLRVGNGSYAVPAGYDMPMG